MSFFSKTCEGCGEISALPGLRICAQCIQGGVSLLPEPVAQSECLRCGGSGEARTAEADQWRGAAGMSGRRCKDCDGSGSVSESQRRSQELLAASSRAVRDEPYVQCPACDGDGCRFCGGEGVLSTVKADVLRDMIGEA